MYVVMKWLVAVLFVSLIGGKSVEVNGQSLRWTALEDLQDSLRTQTRPLMVFIHTDWCKYCQMQQKTTFRDPELVGLLNQKFYCLTLNAEEQKSLKFLGRTYESGSSGNFHSLARMLGLENGKLLFPTTVFYFPDSNVFKRFQGLQHADDLVLKIQ
jgi:thioredoxin-related protein